MTDNSVPRGTWIDTANIASPRAAEMTHHCPVPRGTSPYLNQPVKSAAERALHIAMTALEAIATHRVPHHDPSEYAAEELARVRTLVPNENI